MTQISTLAILMLISLMRCFLNHPAERLWKLVFWSSLAGCWICFVSVFTAI